MGLCDVTKGVALGKTALKSLKTALQSIGAYGKLFYY